MIANMTVAELILKLQNLPQGLPVKYYSYDEYMQGDPVTYLDVTELEVREDNGVDSVLLS